MTVSQLRDEMSNEEFLHWGIYYARIAQQQELEQKQAGGGG